MSLEYKIISSTSQESKKTIIFKVSDVSLTSKSSDSSLLEKIILFTSDKTFLDQLLLDGYIHGSSLTALLLAHFGKKRLEEESLKIHFTKKLSYLYELYKDIRSKLVTDDAKDSKDCDIKSSELKFTREKITSLTKLIHKYEEAKKIAVYNSDILSKIQTDISSLRSQETTIAFDNINQQIAFKRKLSKLLQGYILNSKLYYHSLQPNHFEYFLIQSIELLYSYTFPNPSLTKEKNFFSFHDQIPFTDCSTKPYCIKPNGLDSIKKIQQFYANYDYLLNKDIQKKTHSDINIERDIELDRLTYSRTALNSILFYVKTYKLRTFIFVILAILEIFFLPTISTFFHSIHLFRLFGLGNQFILLGISLPTTVSFINFIFNLPQYLKNLFIKIKESLKSIVQKFQLHNGSVIDTAKTDDHDIFKKYLKIHQSLSSNYFDYDFQKQPVIKSRNLIWKLPFLHSIITYIQKEYKRYSNWYLSYIYRNPLGFSTYVIIRAISLFTKLVHYPFSTYFGLDQATDRALSTEKTDTIFTSPTHYLSKSQSEIIRDKLKNHNYIFLYKNLDGDFLCYKYTNYETEFIKKISISELKCYLTQQSNILKKQPFFYFSTTEEWLSSADIKNKAFCEKIVNGSSIFAVPGALIKPLSFFDRIYNTFQCSFLIIFTKQFIIDLLKTILLRIPLFFCQLLINNVLLSGLHLAFFLLCNIFFKILNFLHLKKLSRKLIILESMIFQFYYNIYYTITSYFNAINVAVDHLESKEFKISRILAALGEKIPIKIAWLHKLAPEVYFRLKNIEAYLSTYSQEQSYENYNLPIVTILKESQELLQTCYDNPISCARDHNAIYDLSKITDKITILDKHIDILNYYREHLVFFSNPTLHKIEFIFSIFKINALYFIISRPEWSLKIYEFIEVFNKIKNSTTENSDKIFSNLVLKLYSLSTSSITTDDIKKQIILPTIDQLAAIYGQEASKLMTKLRTSKEITSIKEHTPFRTTSTLRRRASI